MDVRPMIVDSFKMITTYPPRLSLAGLMILLVILTGCAPTQHQLSIRADRIAQPSGLKPQTVATRGFNVMTYARIEDAQQPLRVYLEGEGEKEGDGKSWLSRISLNPTPHNPVALRLAALDDGPNVLYIARPCQYVTLDEESHCGPYLWSRARYSPKVVEAIDQVISHYVNQMGTESGIELVGYSGGGALAVLMAAKRHDVRNLRTVAANLNTDLFSRLHQVSPMDRSLNPADFSQLTSALPQRHFVGEQDIVMPEIIARSYQREMATTQCVTIAPVTGATHTRGWDELWPSLLNESLSCLSQISQNP